MSAIDFDQPAVLEAIEPTAAAATMSAGGVIVGLLIGFKGTQPLVIYSGQPSTAAIEARATLDLHGAHIGREVVLAFENADPLRPIVLGCLQRENREVKEKPGQVEVDADGERLVITAKEQLVLRCGQASITLSHDGKVAIRGTHVVSHAAGVNRIRGGSVQLN